MGNAGAPVFAYGTLVIPAVMRAVTGRVFPAQPAVALHHARFRVTGCSYPGMLAAAGVRVPGVLYPEVDADSLLRLDRFEGDLYERRFIEVHCPALPGEARRAWAWIVPDHHAHRLTREPWDPEDFSRRHLTEFLAGL